MKIRKVRIVIEGTIDQDDSLGNTTIATNVGNALVQIQLAANQCATDAVLGGMTFGSGYIEHFPAREGQNSDESSNNLSSTRKTLTVEP
jgi:hypothetical protein